MSQRAVERVLGRLLTDEAFRDSFFRQPRQALIPYANDLTPDELDALHQVPRSALTTLCARLDDRICRLRVPGPDPEEQRR